jgi:cysteine desulfurase / selenocysteine lyase
VFELRQKDFPSLRKEVHGKPCVYLDNATSAHQPRQVFNAISQFQPADFPQAIKQIRRFISAPEGASLHFFPSVREAIHCVADRVIKSRIHSGDEIVVSLMEHEANRLPWAEICRETGARLRVVGINEQGEVSTKELKKCLNKKTRLVSICHVSNAIGSLSPVREITEMAHAQGASVFIDGPQAIAHIPVDVQALDCDYYVFSSRKLFGPSGVAILYGKEGSLNGLPNQECDRARQEALAGLRAAMDYVSSIGYPTIASFEKDLLKTLIAGLNDISGLKIIGTPQNRLGIVSFVVDGKSAGQVSEELGQKGIVVRAGNHYANDLMQHFGVRDTVRVSVAFYNTATDITSLLKALSDGVK